MKRCKAVTPYFHSPSIDPKAPLDAGVEYKTDEVRCTLDEGHGGNHRADHPIVKGAECSFPKEARA